MCGRYVTPEEAAMERFFIHLKINPFKVMPRQSFNVAPTQQVPAVRVHNAVREAVTLRWGLIPAFAKGDPGPYSTINARVETVTTTPAYRTAWKRGQRCLVLAKGFYEWQDKPSGRQPFFICCADQEVFGMAGLWDSSTTPEGEVIESCSIITMPASPKMAEIHNQKQREPAIVRSELLETWLTGTAEEAMALLVQYPDELLQAWPVSTKVNNTRNNTPDLLDLQQN
jgi:putative SOS response-associated peptidase YedK